MGALLLLLLPFLLPREASVNHSKSTWLWDTAVIQEDPEAVIDFCMEQQVEVIFLQIQQHVPEEDYRKFIALAHDQKIEVHALNGEPEWAYAQHGSKGDEFLAWVQQYNAGAASEKERFTGVQFDVEPYQLNSWDEEQQQIVAQWSSNMENWLQQAQDQELYTSAAIPFWLSRIAATDGSGTFSSWVISRFDAVAVMAYRDSGEQIIELSKEELQEADELGKSVWIGMELGHTDEGEYVSFHNKGIAVMEDEMQKVTQLGSRYSSFAGVAVHHYEAWRDKLVLHLPEE